MRPLIEAVLYWLVEVIHSWRERRPKTPGAASPEDEFVLGRALDETGAPEQNQEALITLDAAARRRSLHLLGGSGSGKSSLLRRLFLDDVRRGGRAVCAVDPRGDLTAALLLALAAEQPDLRPGRLLLIDLHDPNCYVGFNPLAGPGDAHGRAYFTLDVIRRHAEALGWGVLIEECLRNSLTAIAQAGGTLLDVEPLLTDAVFRHDLLARVADEQVLEFFRRYEEAGSRQAQWSGPTLNKLAPFTGLPPIRAMLGGSQPVSFTDLLRDQPDLIVLISLNTDQLFQAGYLAGNLIVSAFQAAVLQAERAERGAEVTLYLDECQHFATPQLATILSEGRRYGLSLCLSHQYLSQLPLGLRDAVLNNVTVSCFFQTGTDSQEVAGLISGGGSREAWRTVLAGQKVGECVVARRGQPPRRVRLLPGPNLGHDPAVLQALRTAALDAYSQPVGKSARPSPENASPESPVPAETRAGTGKGAARPPRRGKRRSRPEKQLPANGPQEAAGQENEHAEPPLSVRQAQPVPEETIYEIRHIPHRTFKREDRP